MRRDAHDRPGAVIHQDVIRNPHRHALAVERIDGIASGEDAVLFNLANIALFPGVALLANQLIDFRAKIRIRRRKIFDDRMLGRELHRGRAEDRVYARGKDRDRRSRGTEPSMVLCVIEFEIDQRAFAAPDPIPLHGADFFRPAFKLVEPAQQFVGILRRTYEPLLQFTLLNQCVFMPPAAAVHDLLVGQHGRALRTPVHLALLAVRQSLLEELEKEPLIPAVVLRKTGRNLARPVVGEAEPLHLRLHVGDVAQRPLARWRVVLDRGIFRRQSERIPSHGMKHVVAIHPHVARQRIANRIVAHVPHVQRARGIGQHFENVILLLGRVGLGGVKRSILLPALEPFSLNALRVIALVVRTIRRCSGFRSAAHIVNSFFSDSHSEEGTSRQSSILHVAQQSPEQGNNRTEVSKRTKQKCYRAARQQWRFPLVNLSVLSG